jgi:hypothetical protein
MTDILVGITLLACSVALVFAALALLLLAIGMLR